MKCTCMSAIIAIVALGLATSSFAAQEDAKDADRGINCSCEIRNVDFTSADEHQAEMMKEFDKDGDGKLSANERDEAQWSALTHTVEQCQAMRDKFDKDKDGKLSQAEEAEFDKSMAEVRDDSSGLLTKFDADKDGELSAEERKHAIETSMAQSLENWLQKFDKDSDGKLDANESLALMGDIRSSLEERREKMWKQFDSDSDGKLNDMERGSALKAIGDAYQKRHQQMVSKFDADKDGKLSADERKQIQPAAIFCSCDAGDEAKSALKSDDMKSETPISTSADDSKFQDPSLDETR